MKSSGAAVAVAAILSLTPSMAHALPTVISEPIPQPVILGHQIPQPDAQTLNEEGDEYKSIRGKDAILHQEELTRERSSDPVSDKKQLNSYEKEMCKKNPLQCQAYITISADALNQTAQHEGLIKQAPTRNQRDDRRQGFRHEFWFARLQHHMGYQAAFNWAWAHETPQQYNKTEDSRCDLKNNSYGSSLENRISNTGSKHDILLVRGVENNITHGWYCVRKR